MARAIVDQEPHREELKPFHIIQKLLEKNARIEDCKWFSNFVVVWTEKNFLRAIPSDELYIYVVKRRNHQNNRIWEIIEDINIDARHCEIVQDARFNGIFIMFTVKICLCVLKEYMEFGDGAYLRGIIVQQRAISFLRGPVNVLEANEVIFLHDKARCTKTNAMQHLLVDEELKF